MSQTAARENSARATKSDASAPRLEMRSASLRFGRTLALDDVSLGMAPGEIFAVLGESGCGKSSLLRLVAGLEAPHGGDIRIDGRLVSGRPGVPPEARGIGLMFQDHALFPHLTVLDNVRFGLNRCPRGEARTRALARLEEVGLANRARDYPHTLSGGEAQRVALARALAPGPRLLLLDEPFSSLDPATRARVRADTLSLLRAGGTTAILVTHDPAEALEFSDRIALMRKGRVVQSGTGAEIYARPVSALAARALGPVVEIAGRAGAERVETVLGALPAPPGFAPGPIVVCLRPEAIRIAGDGEGVPARVLAGAFAGRETRLSLAVEGLAAPIVLTMPAALAPVEGSSIRLRLDPFGAHVFPAQDG